ncbi:MAG: aminotransferase class I/II-fold pyridoxal phosphate-dependent enzyme [Syntrophobacterales bacterium]|nr:aminotransferase class I/II-fold pyridoxal phosphate-dependent enzyme [Syntrophobacterales bacterium]
MEEFPRMKRLPPYVFATVNALKMEARRRGEDIIDLGMGNPDMGTPAHIVAKLIEAAGKPSNHRYSASKGITKLRVAISDWYKRRFNVDIDPETEAIATIGAKEGLSHLVLATVMPGDVVLVPNPTYPIHAASVVIAGGQLVSVPLTHERDFLADLVQITELIRPRPKMLIISFPHNPTTMCVELDFFREIVDFAKRHDMYVIHDFAYADLVFDGYRAPSFLEVPGAKDVGVELFSLSKSYNMPGWRMGFVVGNKRLVHALTRIKSYLDYGTFQPIQIASIIALNGPYECVEEIVATYKERRDALCRGLNSIPWRVEPPKGTMFVWAKIPRKFRNHMKSFLFSILCLREAKVAVSPGRGFGEFGDDYVRFALVENVHRTNQAVRGFRKMLKMPEEQIKAVAEAMEREFARELALFAVER